MESNKKLELAREFIEFTGTNVFLTGKAGTGKTTFLRSIQSFSSKRVVVAAPTGVAALNAGGVTLHSLFQLPFSPFIPTKFAENGNSSIQLKKFSRYKLALIRSIELLVIDEISMVRSDTLDAVDEVLRHIRRSSKPFGGVQLLMIGDVNQLSPIMKDYERDILCRYYQSQYFFDSLALKECNYITLELEKIYRQSDSEFTSILNDIRERTISAETLNKLNQRYIAGFNPNENEGYIRLTTHNSVANSVNEAKLRALDSKSEYYTATIKEDFPENIYPNDKTLEFKVGAKVIFIKNDTSSEKEYYNGMRGEIVGLNDSYISVKSQDKDEILDIYPAVWENIEYKLNTETTEIEETVKGTFSQFPLKCAWAITIHKSQGLTFDKAIIDTGAAFAYGQVYVALSRIRSLEGVVLSSPIKHSSIIGSTQVDCFNNYIKANVPTNEVLNHCKKSYFEAMLHEIFDFSATKTLSYTMLKIISTNLYKAYPTLIGEFTEYMKTFDTEVSKVSKSFQTQISQIISSEDYEKSLFLKERVQKGSVYFNEKLQTLYTTLNALKGIDIDAKDVRKRFNETLESFNSEVKIKKFALELCSECFDIKEYQKIKAKISAEPLNGGQKFKTKNTDQPKEVIHRELYANLKEWRKYTSETTGVKTSSILPIKSIVQIQATLPCSLKELKKISGIGTKTMNNYADEIIEIVKEFCVSNNIDPVRDGFTSLQFEEEQKNEVQVNFEDMEVSNDNIDAFESENIEKPKRTKKTKKAEKTPSHIITLEMIKNGDSIEEIATKRGVTSITISNHIIRLISLDMLDVYDYINKERFTEAEALIKPLLEQKVSEIKQILEDKVSYFEINIIKAINSKEKQ